MKRIAISFVLIVCGFSLSMSQDAHYLFGWFEDALVTYTNGTQSEERVNYNLVMERFFFIDPENGNVLMLSNPKDISTIEIADRIFVLNNEVGLEVLSTDPIVYVQYKVNVRRGALTGAYGMKSETSTIESLGHIYVRGERIELAPKDLSVTSQDNVYWVEKNGKRKKFTNFKQLLKMYPGHKNTIKKYIDNNNIEFNEAEQIAKLCAYADTL